MSILDTLEKASKAQNDSFRAVHKTGDIELITQHAEVTCAIMDAEREERERLRKEWRRKHPIKAFYYDNIWQKYTSYWHKGGWSWCFHTWKPEGNYSSYTCKCGDTIRLATTTYSWKEEVTCLMWQEKVQRFIHKLIPSKI